MAIFFQSLEEHQAKKVVNLKHLSILHWLLTRYCNRKAVAQSVDSYVGYIGVPSSISLEKGIVPLTGEEEVGAMA